MLHSPAGGVIDGVVDGVVVILGAGVVVGGLGVGVVGDGVGQAGGGGLVHEVAGGLVEIVLILLLSWHCCWLQVLPVNTSTGCGTSVGSVVWKITATSTL